MRELTVRLFIPHPWMTSICTRLLSKSPGIRLAPESRQFDVGILDAASFNCLLTLLRDAGCPNNKMLVLVNSADENECLQWLDQGAHGVLPYDECAEDLVRAVQIIAQGQLWAPAEVVTRWILTERQRQSIAQFPGLTPRETAVARRMLAGLSNQEIADNLYISLSTVNSHIASIYRKAAVHGRAQLVPITGRFRTA
jgi:DNA-binding NarL/FixJ family response regulator